MSFSITLKQGDTRAYRIPVLEPKSAAEVWAEGGGTGGIDGYWADFAAWIAGGGAGGMEAFLQDRAPDVVRNRVVDLTDFSVRCHMRSGGQKIADLDVRFESRPHGGLYLHFPAAQTAGFDIGTYTAQVEFTKGEQVVSSDIIKITIEGDVTYE